MRATMLLPGLIVHEMGYQKRRGKMAILAGVGPMGLGAIDYALAPGSETRDS